MEGYKCSCECKGTCVVEVIISIIVGIVAGILFSSEIITTVTGLIIIALITSAVGLAVLLGSIFAANLLENCVFKKCICKKAICLLVSILGTLILGTVALLVTLTASAIASILIVALTVFFFIWTVLSIFTLLFCLIKETCN